MHPVTNEDLLLNQLAEGSEQAFRLLFDKYKDKVYAFAFKFTRSVPQSEEIVQEIFLKVWTDRAAMAGIQNFQSWLYTLARNKSFNVLKRIAYDYSYRKNIDPNPSYGSVEDSLVLKQYQQIVSKAVEQLSPRQKDIYRLRREDGLKINEIAEKLNIAPNTVKVHLVNALNHIRKALDGKMEPVIVLVLTSFFSK